jgi:hypothetical protein
MSGLELEPGMILILQAGVSLLVGDINTEGCGGRDRESEEEDSIVVEVWRLDLSELS